MLRSVRELYGYQILATDEAIGKVDDFFIDDESWTVRYLVVETGNWFSSKRVLISPEALVKPDWTTMLFPVTLTKEQIKDSPDVDTERPVSREQEEALREFYGWPLYWGGFMAPAGTAGYWPTPTETHRQEVAAGRGTVSAASVREREIDTKVDTHLRSTKEVGGYHIQANDGEIGHVHDFILDDETWAVRYLVVDTRNWLPGKKVLVSPYWVESVDWTGEKVHVGLTQDGVKGAPEYDENAPVNRQYEEQLFDYHGRPKYWS